MKMKKHIVEPATAEHILTSLKISKKMWPKSIKKKKKKNWQDSVLVVCKKCGEQFWPYYIMKETGRLETVCFGCKPQRKEKPDANSNISK